MMATITFEEEVRVVAFKLYLKRVEKNVNGSAEEDWSKATQLVSQSRKKQEENARDAAKSQVDRDFPYGYDRGKEGYKLP
jgi:hypothetical protein